MATGDRRVPLKGANAEAQPFCACATYPSIHLAQDGHRYTAAQNNRVVEATQVKLRAELSLCFRAQAGNLRVTYLVPARLARPRTVAVNLTGHLLRVRTISLYEEFDALLSRPALGMQPCINHQAARAKRQ